jgi:hypothetical protein
MASLDARARVKPFGGPDSRSTGRAFHFSVVEVREEAGPTSNLEYIPVVI